MTYGSALRLQRRMLVACEEIQAVIVELYEDDHEMGDELPDEYQARLDAAAQIDTRDLHN